MSSDSAVSGGRSVRSQAGRLQAGESRSVRSWAFAGSLYGFALGQILFVALDPDLTLVQTAAVQIGLFGLLVAPGVRDAPIRTLVPYVVAVAGLVGVVASVRDTAGELWMAALALSGVVALASYGFHRYELVTLDLVEADT